MIASVRSSATGSSHEATPARTARIAELNKRVGALQLELKAAQQMKPAELAGLRSNSISQDIDVANSQIEKIALATQLARLSPQSEGPVDQSRRWAGTESHRETSHDTDRNGDPFDVSKAGKASKAKDSAGVISSTYRAAADQPRHINLEA